MREASALGLPGFPLRTEAKGVHYPDMIFADHFSRDEPGVFAPLRDTLLTHGDHYRHLADLKSHLEADQRLVALYADPDGWARKATLNVAGSGKFSSDRTIAEYAAGIWNADLVAGRERAGPGRSVACRPPRFTTAPARCGRAGRSRR
jgi:hypothetical protein